MSLVEQFEKACPYYIKCGMTYEQFWDGDVFAHKAYRQADRMRISEKNQMAWLQGAYIYEAIVAVAPYVKAFSKAKPKPYAKNPFDIFEEERKRREEKEQRERYERMKEKVAAFAKAFNEKKKTEREVDDSARCDS